MCGEILLDITIFGDGDMLEETFAFVDLGEFKKSGFAFGIGALVL